MRVLRFATTNRHKVREVRDLLTGMPVRVDTLAGLPAGAEPEESADTFEGNARIKALHYAARCPGEYVVSEDSGLEVDALGGAPGVHSARFLGPEASYQARFDAILTRLRDVPEADRTARFVCALAVARDGVVMFETRGAVEGTVAHAPAGHGGFGYDPIFFSPTLGCTLAEAGDRKAAVSHRAQAIAALARWVRDLR
jgi:XTP/dITP diphosphohydrolase